MSSIAAVIAAILAALMMLISPGFTDVSDNQDPVFFKLRADVDAGGMITVMQEADESLIPSVTNEQAIRLKEAENENEIAMKKAENDRKVAEIYKEIVDVERQRMEIQCRLLEAKANVEAVGRWNGNTPANILPQNASLLYPFKTKE